MPVALPPPALPQAVPVEQVQRSPAARQQYRFGQFNIHLLAFDGFKDDELQFLVTEAADAEKLVLALAQLAYSRGALSSRVVYAVAGQELYIMLIRRSVRRVTGDENMQRFFADLPRGGEFRFADFERERVLASGYADRAGLHVQPRFADAPNGQVDLILQAQRDPAADRFSIHAEASNQGSRFSGRNLLSLGMTGATAGGFEAGLQFKTSPSGANDDRAASEYVEGAVQLSRITTAGIVGVNARRIQFTLEQPMGIEGWYQEAGLEWSSVLGAGIASRSLLRVRGSYSDRASERSMDSLDLFHERYGAVEVNPSWAFRNLSQRVEVSGSLIAGQSISTHNSAAEDTYQLARPILRYGWQQSDTFSFSVLGAGQWSGQVLPEAQQWTLGGMGSMAAYLPATFYGDSGHYLRIGQEAAWTRGAWKTSIEIFGEQGSVKSDAGNRAPIDRVSDAGVALGLRYGRGAELKLVAARPVGSADTEGVPAEQEASFYASLTLTY